VTMNIPNNIYDSQEVFKLMSGLKNMMPDTRYGMPKKLPD